MGTEKPATAPPPADNRHSRLLRIPVTSAQMARLQALSAATGAPMAELARRRLFGVDAAGIAFTDAPGGIPYR